MLIRLFYLLLRCLRPSVICRANYHVMYECTYIYICVYLCVRIYLLAKRKKNIAYFLLRWCDIENNSEVRSMRLTSQLKINKIFYFRKIQNKIFFQLLNNELYFFPYWKHLLVYWHLTIVSIHMKYLLVTQVIILTSLICTNRYRSFMWHRLKKQQINDIAFYEKFLFLSS